ncbi:Zn-ribbon domain-containing OB-fold protein [Bradyrhizobium japonicum]|uniref:Zn-ribbon domain-containing OB-fold protein n=1 Tax=Bradyrhizobium japonicum TaxID=375 RepID=UPI003D9B7B0D
MTHHPFHDGYRSDLPYTLVTVDLEEGVRMLARLHAPADTRLDIGMSVRLVFEKAKPGLTLPGFVLAAPATDMSVPSSG